MCMCMCVMLSMLHPLLSLDERGNSCSPSLQFFLWRPQLRLMSQFYPKHATSRNLFDELRLVLLLLLLLLLWCTDTVRDAESITLEASKS